jgi:hypothetical protein
MRRFFAPTGSVIRIAVESHALESNMLGDPSVRSIDIYLPAGHDGRDLPLLVDLVGFTGSGLSHTNWVEPAGAARPADRRTENAACGGRLP